LRRNGRISGADGEEDSTSLRQKGGLVIGRIELLERVTSVSYLPPLSALIFFSISRPTVIASTYVFGVRFVDL